MGRPHVLVVGIVAVGLLAGLAVAAVTPSQPTTAQPTRLSGNTVVFAERACLDYGVMPGTHAYYGCVRSAARAFERGEPDIAYMQARSARDARPSP